MQHILFIELLGGMGGILIALPAIQALGRTYPQAHLTVLTLRPGGELLRTDPLIREVVYADQDVRGAVAQLLRSRSFDLIVSNTNHSGIEQLIRQRGTPQTVTNLWRSPLPDQRVGEQFIAILLAEQVITPEAVAPPYLHLTAEEYRQARQRLADSCPPCILLVPDAGMAIKRWPEAYFVAFGRAVQHRYGASVIIVQGNERQQAARIAQAMGGNVQVWPRGTLREVAAAVRFADLVVSGDTGLAHVAAIQGVRTITLFGPSWHGRYGQPAPHINLQGYPQCTERVIANFTEQRCWYAGVCPLGLWPTCMEAITPAEVLAAAHPYLLGRGQVVAVGNGGTTDAVPAVHE